MVIYAILAQGTHRAVATSQAFFFCRLFVVLLLVCCASCVSFVVACVLLIFLLSLRRAACREVETQRSLFISSRGAALALAGPAGPLSVVFPISIACAQASGGHDVRGRNRFSHSEASALLAPRVWWLLGKSLLEAFGEDGS